MKAVRSNMCIEKSESFRILNVKIGPSGLKLLLTVRLSTLDKLTTSRGLRKRGIIF